MKSSTNGGDYPEAKGKGRGQKLFGQGGQGKHRRAAHVNGLLNAEADELCQASKYERSPDRQNTQAGPLHEDISHQGLWAKAQDPQTVQSDIWNFHNWVLQAARSVSGRSPRWNIPGRGLRAQDRRCNTAAMGYKGKPKPPDRGHHALCYFFTELLNNTNAKDAHKTECLIVLDDPVSSFDLENRVGIISYLKSQMLKTLRGNLNSRIIREMKIRNY